MAVKKIYYSLYKILIWNKYAGILNKKFIIGRLMYLYFSIEGTNINLLLLFISNVLSGLGQKLKHGFIIFLFYYAEQFL